jgi:hypothetical protein
MTDKPTYKVSVKIDGKPVLPSNKTAEEERSQIYKWLVTVGPPSTDRQIPEAEAESWKFCKKVLQAAAELIAQGVHWEREDD